MLRKGRKLFEHDRRTELRLRLEVKRRLARERAFVPVTGAAVTVEPELVDRLIERVRQL